MVKSGESSTTTTKQQEQQEEINSVVKGKENLIKERAEINGYQIVNAAKDGDCYIHALIGSSATVRQIITNIRENSSNRRLRSQSEDTDATLFRNFIIDKIQEEGTQVNRKFKANFELTKQSNFGVTLPSRKEYLRRMRMNGEWMDSLMVSMTSIICNITIYVHIFHWEQEEMTYSIHSYDAPQNNEQAESVNLVNREDQHFDGCQAIPGQWKAIREWSKTIPDATPTTTMTRMQRTETEVDHNKVTEEIEMHISKDRLGFPGEEVDGDDSQSEDGDIVIVRRVHKSTTNNQDERRFDAPRGSKLENFQKTLWPIMLKKYEQISRLMDEGNLNPGNLHTICNIYEIRYQGKWNLSTKKELFEAHKKLIRMCHPDSLSKIYGNKEITPIRYAFVANALVRFFNDIRENVERRDISSIFKNGDKKGFLNRYRKSDFPLYGSDEFIRTCMDAEENFTQREDHQGRENTDETTSIDSGEDSPHPMSNSTEPGLGDFCEVCYQEDEDAFLMIHRFSLKQCNINNFTTPEKLFSYTGELFANVYNIILDALLNATDNKYKMGAFKWYVALPQIFFRQKFTKDKMTSTINQRLQLFIGGEYKALLDLWENDIKVREQYLRKNRNVKPMSRDQMDRRAIELIKKGSISKGLRIAMGNGVGSMDNPHTWQQMVDKHPQEEDICVFPDLDIDIEEIDLSQCHKFIREADPRKGVGKRGFRVGWLQGLLSLRNPIGMEAMSKFEMLGKLFLSRKLDLIFRNTLLGGILTPLNKEPSSGTDEVTDCRPATASDADTITWSRTLCRRFATETADILLPEQVGVGVPSGISIKTWGLQLTIEQLHKMIEESDSVDTEKTFVVETLDIKNAHNDFSRRALYTELMKNLVIHPNLKPLISGIFSVMEATPEIYTRNKHGLQLLCKATRGGQQGEPFTNFAYALLIDPTLKKCTELYPEAVNKAVQDDGAIIGDKEVVHPAKAFLTKEFEDRLGLTINKLKEKRYVINKRENECGEHNEQCVEVEGTSHYGITICSVPIGSREYVSYKFKQRIDEIMDQIVDLTERFNKIDSQVAFTAIKVSFQNKLDYLISNLPVHITKPLLQRVDDTIIKCFEKAIGSKFSMDDSDDPDFVKDRMCSRCSMGGGGIRPLITRYAFLNCLNNIIPKMAKIWPSLSHITGDFDTINEEGRWTTFFDKSPIIGKELKEMWMEISDRYQQIKGNLNLSEEEMTSSPIEVINGEVNNFGHNRTKNITHVISTEFAWLNAKLMSQRALNMDTDDPRRMSYISSNSDQFANSIFNALPTEKVSFQPIEFQESACSRLGLPSPSMKGVVGLPIKAKNQQVVTDEYGHNVKNITGVAGGHRTIFHNKVHSVMANSIYNAGIDILGKPPQTCANIFNDIININGDHSNDEGRVMQGIIPDMIIRDNQERCGDHEDPKTIYDNLDTLLDVKTLGPGQCYRKNWQQQPVEARQNQVNTEYYRHARELDAKFQTDGKVENRLKSYGKDGTVGGLVCGAFGECSSHMHQLATLVSKHQTGIQASGLHEDEARYLRAKNERSIKNLWGLTIHREWARLLIGRTALLVRKELITEDIIGDEDDLNT